MNDDRFDQKALRAYLLGELEDADQESVESAYLRQPELCAELLALEDELIDDLVAARLAPSQAAALERRLRLAPDGDARLSLAQALAARGNSVLPVRPSAPAPVVSSPWAPTWMLAAALLLCAGLSTYFGLRARTLEHELREARAERERLNHQGAELQSRAQALSEELERERRTSEALEEQARVRQPGAVVRLLLAAGLTRDGHAQAEVKLPPAASALHLLLALDDEPLERYSARLQTPEGRNVWRQNELAPRSAGGQRVVVFHVPTEHLAPGDYVVLLEGGSASGPSEAAGEYAFRIKR